MKRLAIICTTLGVLAMSASAAVPTLTENWGLGAGNPATTWFANDNNTRSAAYNPVTDHVLVASRTGGANIRILNASDGAVVGALDASPAVITGGVFVINEIDVADDGAIYLCNLVTSAGTGFKVYRWANESAPPTTAVPAGSVNQRTGDSFAVRGSGTSTVLYASGSGNQFIEVFTTADGVNFTDGTDIDLGTVSLGRMGLAPRTDNTNFFLSSNGTPKREVNSAGVLVSLIDSNDSEGLNNAMGDLGFAEINGVDLLVAASGNYLNPDTGSTARFGRVLRVTASTASPFIIGDTPNLLDHLGASNANTNGTGAATFDTARGSAIILISNNRIGSYGTSLPVELTSFDTE